MTETNRLRTDEPKLAIQQAQPQPRKMEPKEPRRRHCCVEILVVALIIVVALALTVFKIKKPRISFNATRLESLSYAVHRSHRTMMKLRLNVTLVSEMSIKNPNKAASFQFSDSTVIISYRGSTAGHAAIPAGKIEADKTAHMNITATVFIDDLMSNSNLIADGISGNLTVSASTTIAGRFILLQILKKRAIIYSSCDVTVNIFSRTAQVENFSSTVKL
jgi:hypothetical protein